MPASPETQQTESAPTPGPWRDIEGAGRLLVDAPTRGQMWVDATDADRALLLAAPDLLAACKEFVRKVDAGEARSTASYEQMRAAIAKAEGRS